jgi:hypothetical protein
MALEDYIIRSSSGSADTVTLYHGSALTYCHAIATGGVNYEQMINACAGAHSFCTTLSFEEGKGYALLNPLVFMQGQPAGVLRANFPYALLEDWIRSGTVRWVLPDQACEFADKTIFSAINQVWTDVSVRTVTSATIRFEE